jgi:hypothetical protein
MLCEGTSTRPGGISPRDQAKLASGVSSSDNAFWDDWMFSNSASGICKFAWHAILGRLCTRLHIMTASAFSRYTSADIAIGNW